MERLTKKVGENYCSQSGDFYDLYNKLGQLEDLEEKIDCPLDVRERALKTFYWEEFENDENIKNYYVYAFNNEFLYVCFTYDKDGILTTKETVLPLQYYKKYWWLKKDKSE